MCAKNKSSIHETVKKEKEVCATLAVAPHTAKFKATVCNKCLIKMEMALNVWGVGDINRTCVPIDSNVLSQKALSLHKGFRKGSPEMSEAKAFIASRDELHRFWSRFGMRNLKLTRQLHLLVRKLLPHFQQS